LCEHVFCFSEVGFGGFEAGVHHRGSKSSLRAIL
jgi:hypothetical protein